MYIQRIYDELKCIYGVYKCVYTSYIFRLLAATIRNLGTAEVFSRRATTALMLVKSTNNRIYVVYTHFL